MRNRPRVVVLASALLLLGIAACGGPRDGVACPAKEPDPEPLAASKPILCEGHSDWVEVVAVSPDGRLIVSGSKDGTLRFWDAADGKAVRTVKLFDPSVKDENIGPLAFSPDGKTLAATRFKKGRGELLLYDPATGKPAAVRWPGHEGGTALRFTPDGKALAVGGQGAVRVWGFPKGDKLHEFPLPRSKRGGVASAQEVAFTPDGKLLAAAHNGAGGPRERSGPTVRVWDLATGKSVYSAREDADTSPFTVAFSPNGRLLAFRGAKEAGDVEVYDWRRGKRVVKFKADRDNYVIRLAFAPDGRTLYSCGHDPEVKRWVPATGKSAGHLKGLTDTVQAIAQSKDGKVVAAGGQDRRVAIWHLGVR